MDEKILLKHDEELSKHIREVRDNLAILTNRITDRGYNHDKSKWESPEREIFAAALDRLGKCEYGSEEYKKMLADLKPALDSHYSKNRHHIENHYSGINDMDLVDLVELLCDWKAATKRSPNGDIHKSIELNKTKYDIAPQLAQILTNTVNRYF